MRAARPDLPPGAFHRLLHWFAVFALGLLLGSPGVSCHAGEAAGSDDLDTLLAQVRERVGRTATVQCSFEQERALSVFAHPILFTGRMALRRPSRLRWENLTPIPSVLVFAGEKGFRCNDDAPPVHFELDRDPLMRMIAEQLWTWIDGDYAALRDRYEISLSGDHEIRLRPREGGFAGAIQSVTVRFSADTLQPESIVILEPGGDSTTIRFAAYRINEPVDEKLFETCAPSRHP
ncbi:MAG: hypothetical protein Kow0089_05600 [Desulfobulbaceae bacterium]